MQAIAILFIALLMLCGCAGEQSESSLAGSKPNIVLILADDLSYRDLSIWGQRQFSTPNLDRLARSGLRFTQSYAGAPECAPSRGTLMTGLHTGHGPIRENSSARGQDHLADADITMAEVLKRAGYATAFTGKWGIGLPGTPGTPDKQGFDHAYGFYDQQRAHTYYPHFLYHNAVKVPLPGNYGFDLQRLYRNNVPDPDPADLNRYDENGDLIPVGIADPSQAKFSETLIEESALGFVRENAGEPFFLYFATQLPHGPVIIDNLGNLKDRDDYPGIKHKEWAAMVERLDRFTGELVDLLRELDIYDNTIIFFASDNGYANCGYFGRGNANNNWPDDPFFRNKGPFRGGKFSVLEGGIRVPFFVTWEGKIDSGISDEPVWLIDLFPTAAALAGVPLEHEIDGLDLLPLLESRPEDFPGHHALYWQKRNEQAVRMGAWKAYREHPDQPVELYLVEEDTYGERNLASFYPEVVAEVERIMDEESTEHPWYHNPGETREDREAKRARAEELGQLQKGLVGNSTK